MFFPGEAEEQRTREPRASVSCRRGHVMARHRRRGWKLALSGFQEAIFNARPTESPILETPFDIELKCASNLILSSALYTLYF